jgi:hypothetical protein
VERTNLNTEQVRTAVTCVREVTGSNIGRNTGYPDRFSWYSSDFTAEIRAQYLKIAHNASIETLIYSPFMI